MKEHCLQWKDSMIRFSEGSGEYALETCGFHLGPCRASARMDGRNLSFGPWKTSKITSKSITASAHGSAGELELKISLPATGGISLALRMTRKNTEAPLDLFYFTNLELEADHLLSQGGYRGGCGLFRLVRGTDAKFLGGMAMIATRGGKQLSLSYPLCCGLVPEFTGRALPGKIAEWNAGSEIRHYSSKTVQLEPLTVRAGDGFRLLEKYACENAPEGKIFDSNPGAGWNSWDYYRWTVTEDEVLANAEFIAADPVLSKYVKRIVIDDGWQYAYGEWKPNSLFPHGMRFLADRIREMGFEPGLWIAPLICEPHSRMAQLDCDLFGMSECGLPALGFNCMERHGFVLDPTKERTRSFIRDLIAEYADQGYSLFKLDFLWGLQRLPRYADEKVPNGKLEGLAIRAALEGAAGRARILGCGYSFCTGGIVDSVRIGADIHARWDSLTANAPAVAGHHWCNRKLWINDPDFALCRSLDTSDDPDINRLQPCYVGVTPSETNANSPAALYRQVNIFRPQSEILLSLVVVSGGSVNLSDKMPLLNKAGLDLARRTVSAVPGETGIPLDLFESTNPKYYLQKIPGGYRALLINWSDKPAALSMDLKKHGIDSVRAVNFWTDEPVSAQNGKICAELPARSCLFAIVTPK